MSDSTRRAAPALGARLLAEVVRLREERSGHAVHTPEADAAARRAGGDFARRIAVRAAHAADAAETRAALKRLYRSALVLSLLAAGVATIAGVTAASATLAASDPVSLPLALAVLVAPNLLTLLSWLALQPWSRRAAPGLARLLQFLWGRCERGTASAAPGAAGELLRVLAAAAGRWLIGAVVHAIWLLFSISALLTLALLLSVRSYALGWETTLLSPAALESWARALSLGPGLLGVPGASSLPVAGPYQAGDSEAWALWLLAAVLAYGVLPRAIALLACAGLAGRALSRIGTELSRPGYARLRARLLPEQAPLGIVDAAAPLPRSEVAPAPRAAPARCDDGLVVGLEWSPPGAAALGEGCRWLGAAEDAATLQRLRAGGGAPLFVVARAPATPDRGHERVITALLAAHDGPAQLLLAGHARLTSRGEAVARQRIEQWRALAQRCGLAEPRVLDEGQTPGAPRPEPAA